MTGTGPSERKACDMDGIEVRRLTADAIRRRDAYARRAAYDRATGGIFAVVSVQLRDADSGGAEIYRASEVASFAEYADAAEFAARENENGMMRYLGRLGSDREACLIEYRQIEELWRDDSGRWLGAGWYRFGGGVFPALWCKDEARFDEARESLLESRNWVEARFYGSGLLPDECIGMSEDVLGSLLAIDEVTGLHGRNVYMQACDFGTVRDMDRLVADLDADGLPAEVPYDHWRRAYEKAFRDKMARYGGSAGVASGLRTLAQGAAVALPVPTPTSICSSPLSKCGVRG